MTSLVADWPLLLVLAATVAASALVQGAIGVGFGLIVAPALALLRPDLMPGTVLLLMLPLNAFVAWRERAHLDWPSAGWITAGRFLGTFAGLGVLALLSLRTLNLLIGVTTVAAALVTLRAPRFAPSRSAFAGAGLITGVTETASGIGGPPLALVYQHYAPASLRATIALCFLVGEIFSLLLLAADGRLGLAQLSAALLLLPPLALGLALTSWAHRHISAKRMRNALLIFAIVSGLVLIVQALATTPATG